MKMSVQTRAFWRIGTRAVLALAGALSVHAGTVTVKSKSPKSRPKILWLFTPTPLPEPTEPVHAAMPLLGPAGELMPGGKLLIWVGRTDAPSVLSDRVMG